MTIKMLVGDVRDRLQELPDESVHCVVTSPPYWGLRDYGVAGQLGLEPTLGEHVETMADIFDEVRRVLRKDGTLWLNYGDSYAASINGRSAHDTKLKGNDDRTFRDKPFSTVGSLLRWDRKSERNGHNFDSDGQEVADCRPGPGGVLKAKDLCGIPWRVAFALQERGWWLRQDIIWAKPNPMPESVTDRCTKAHEYVFLLAKSPRYYFDQEAIREEAEYGRKNWNDVAGTMRRIGGNDSKINQGDARWTGCDPDAGRNKRSVWTIATAPFAEAHFATFPPALSELCIKAGCPKGGTVLDPFGGAGTTGLAADRLQRHAILIELNPAYAAMAQARIDGDRGGLLDLMEAAK